MSRISFLLFPNFSSVVYSSHRRCVQVKRRIILKGIWELKTLGVDPFLDPIPGGHFKAPWYSFWILQAIRCCNHYGIACGEWKSPVPLGWCYCHKRSIPINPTIAVSCWNASVSDRCWFRQLNSSFPSRVMRLLPSLAMSKILRWMLSAVNETWDIKLEHMSI